MFSIQDFKTAFHSLSKVKGYVFTIVLTLGITLGALVAMFNLNYQILAAPLPYPDANRLVVLKSQQFEKGKPTNIQASPYPLVIETYKQKDEFFSQKAIVSYTNSIERRWPDSPVLTTISTTPDFFNMLDVPMAKGRRFSAEEDLDSMMPVAIISHEAWQKYFQLDPDILGKTLNIMEIDFKIIGVLGEGFVEPELLHRGWRTDVWLPMDYDDVVGDLRKNWRVSPRRTFVVGKLDNSVERELAQHQINQQSARRFKEEMQAINENPDLELSVSLVPFDETIKGDSSKQSLMMLAGVLVLLLISAANIINLVLARANQQQRTMAIQLALGAQKQHLFNAVLAELIWLMLGATLLSLLVASMLLKVIFITADGLLPRLHELHINFLTVSFAALVSLALAVIFALLVSRQIDMRRLNGLLQTSGKGVGLQISTSVRHLLIFIQIALTGILLTISMHLFIQSSQQLTQDLGYRTSNHYQARLSIATFWTSTTKEQRRAYFEAVVEELRQDQKIELVGLSSGSPVPYRNAFRNWVLQPGADNKILASDTWCNGSFLKLLEIPLVAGRYFTDEEERTGDNKLVVNQILAKLIDAKQDVVGKIIYLDGDSRAYEIVGVVRDLQIPSGQKMAIEEPRAFRSNVQDDIEILIRVKPGQRLTATDINRHAAKVHPEMKVFYLETTEEALSKFTNAQKTITGLTASLSILVLLLAAIGIYGIFNYSVQLRRFELGVRMAIGARPAIIFLHIFKDNLMPVMLGLIVSILFLIGLWIGIQQTSYELSTSLLGWCLPLLLILLLTSLTSFLSVQKIIRKPCSEVLRDYR
jgi:putative ABC transport system permease protein